MIIRYDFDGKDFDFKVDIKEEKKAIAEVYTYYHSCTTEEAYQWLDENDMFDEFEEEHHSEVFEMLYDEMYEKALETHNKEEEDYKDYQSFLRSLPR